MSVSCTIKYRSAKDISRHQVCSPEETLSARMRSLKEKPDLGIEILFKFNFNVCRTDECGSTCAVAVAGDVQEDTRHGYAGNMIV